MKHTPTLLALLALSGAELAQTPDPELVATPAGPQVLHAFGGVEYEHVGIGASTLGDVDGDGAEDFLLGSLDGAYTFCCGRGRVRAISGRTGAELLRVTGREGDGDGFGDTMRAVGDLDRDGVSDFAVGAWYADLFDESTTNQLEYVRLFSGSTGEVLFEVDAPEPYDGFGSWLRPAGDVDGDGRADVLIGDKAAAIFGYGDHLTWVVSGDDGRRLHRWEGLGEGPTVDLDDDGIADFLFWSDERALVRSGASGDALLNLVAGAPGGWQRLARDAVDFDGDGALDPITVDAFRPVSDEVSPALELVVHDGAGDGPLRRHRIEESRRVGSATVCPLGDLTGDGVPEIALGLDMPTGGRVRILDGASGALRHTLRPAEADPKGEFGSRLVALGDVDGDDRPDLLVGYFESQIGAKCAGRAWVVTGL